MNIKSINDDPFEEPMNKKHILAVDDDRSVLKLLKSVLSEKYDVTAIASGKMAEQFLETKATDLILLDYEMPDISGPILFRNLKANPKTAEIPVVFLTGVTSVDKVKHVLSYKPNGYLIKPVDVQRLITTIESIIG